MRQDASPKPIVGKGRVSAALPSLSSAQPVDLHPDMGAFGRRIGKRDRPVEGLPCLGLAGGLPEKAATHAVEIEITVELAGKRLDNLKPCRRPLELGNGD